MDISSIDEQIESIITLQESVTFETIEISITKPLGYTLITFGLLKNQTGIINFLYTLTVENNVTKSKESWILRLSNPHPWWKNDKTKWEIMIHEILTKYCDNSIVPVPKIIAYQLIDDHNATDINSNLTKSSEKNLKQRQINDKIKRIKGEYIVFEKLPGVTLETLIENNQLSTADKRCLFEQMCNVIKNLRNINNFIDFENVLSNCNQFSDNRNTKDKDDIDNDKKLDEKQSDDHCFVGTFEDLSLTKPNGICKTNFTNIGPFFNLITYFESFFEHFISLLKPKNLNKTNDLFDEKIIVEIEKSFDYLLKHDIKQMNDEINSYASSNNNCININGAHFQMSFLNHIDFHDGNILVIVDDDESKISKKADNKDENGLSRVKISGIIDWEGAYWTPFPYDIEFALQYYYKEWGLDQDKLYAYQTVDKMNYSFYKDILINKADKDEKEQDWAKMFGKMEQLFDIIRYCGDIVFWPVTMWKREREDYFKENDVNWNKLDIDWKAILRSKNNKDDNSEYNLLKKCIYDNATSNMKHLLNHLKKLVT